MILDHRCFFCFTRAFEKLLAKENISLEAKNNFTRGIVNLYANNWSTLKSPEFAHDLHSLMKKYTNNPDPYISEKRENNDQAISLIPELDRLIRESNNSFNIALRLAIAGNIIDFAANDNFDLFATIEMALKSEFSIDHSVQLKERIERAESILYLGDNAGEIVFDKLFIKKIRHHNLTFAVRGAPVINDATMEDAEYVGMKDVANVISNGYDAPSTVLHKSDKQFQKYFREADLIISKGQGNLEGLFELSDDRIFYLLMVKCNVIGELLKVEKDSLVVFNSSC